jgi:hypothetical protein
LIKNNGAIGVSDLMNLGLVMQKIDRNQRFFENLHEKNCNFKNKNLRNRRVSPPVDLSQSPTARNQKKNR